VPGTVTAGDTMFGNIIPSPTVQPTIYFGANGNFGLFGSTSGLLQLAVPATVTSYTITLPSAQGTGPLSNNGSGSLSWGSAAPQSTLTGTAGTAVCSQPEQGSSYKKVIAYLSGYTDTGAVAYTFPVAFLEIPAIVYAAAGVTATVSTTQVTFASTAATGFVVLEGY